MKQILSFVAIALFISSCQQKETAAPALVASVSTTDAQAAIQKLDDQFAIAMGSGDSAAIANAYTADAKVFPPNGPATDRAGMASMIKSLQGLGVKAAHLASSEIVSADESMIVECGKWEMGDGTKNFDNGKFLVVWKKQNGEWKIYRDIWNSDNAPAAPAK